MLGKLKMRAGMDPRGERSESEAAPLSPAERWQSWALRLTIVAALLGVMAATGASPIPRGTPALAWWLHPVVVLLGFFGGALSIKRAREIDRERWQIVDDDALTSGERQWAHKEAERQMRSAATVFLLASSAVGAWLAYQTRVPGTITAADLLVATPVLGFGLGLLLANRRYPKVVPAHLDEFRS